MSSAEQGSTGVFGGHKWSKLLRNSRDTGATSILARQILDKTIKLLAEGFQQVEQMAVTSAQVRTTSAQLASTNSDIRQVSQQTKIVSINAGIEAQRAGSSGMAFAVVAQQMTHLSGDVQGLSLSIEAKLSSLNEKIGSNQELSAAVNRLFQDVRDELDEFHRLMMRIEELSLIQVEQLQELERGTKNVSI